MSYTIVPAVKAALAEATRRWPRRSRTCDGTIGDAAHSSRASDHNPNEHGEVLAFDLTHDPAHGCDAHALVLAAVRRHDRRIKYAISRGRIWSDARAIEGWRPYFGSNPHDKHAHVSIKRRYRADTSPWWPTPKEDDDVTPEDIKAIAKAAAAEVRKDIVTVLRAKDQPSIKSLDERLARIEQALGGGK